MSAATVTLAIAPVRGALVRRLIGQLGLHPDDAAISVEHWLRSEQAGKPCHGLIRAHDLLCSGRFARHDGRAAPAPTRLAPGRLHVDGVGSLGYPIVHRLIDHGCREARAHGHCLATGAGVYPSGALGDWARLACAQGCGLILLGGSPPRVAAPAGVTPLLGTNPICVGLPTEPPFICDSSTSAITHGDLLLAQASDAPLPADAAVDDAGACTRIAAEVAALRSIGGSHKSFALAMAVELLCCLGGGVPGSPRHDEHGVFALVLGPAVLADLMPRFSERLAGFARTGARIPGWRSGSRAAADPDTVTLSAASHARLAPLLRTEDLA